jgi:methionine-rich copper-binding protein CopC
LGTDGGVARLALMITGVVMKTARVACALILVGCSTLAFAHARLVKSDPAEGSTVKAAPTRFVLTFGEPAKLTTLTLQKGAEPAKKIGPLPTNASPEISVPAPKLVPGKYVLAWRVVGSDGHVLPGKVTFTVAATPATTKAPGSISP